MVKRRAPKRDPSLPLMKLTPGAFDGPSGGVQGTADSEGSSGKYDAEYVMKMKIKDLGNQISSTKNTKQQTSSEMRNDEAEILSIHNKIQLLETQKQKLQHSMKEKGRQVANYSSKIEKLTSQKEHLVVALDIMRDKD